MNPPHGFHDSPHDQYGYGFPAGNYEVLWPEPEDPNAAYSNAFCDPNHVAYPATMIPLSTIQPADKLPPNGVFQVPGSGPNSQIHYTFRTPPQPQARATPSLSFQSQSQVQVQVQEHTSVRRLARPGTYIPSPSTKRQKVNHPHPSANEHADGAATALERCYSQTGSQSTCCSSCPEGVPCAEPDCQLDVATACTDCDGGIPRCNELNCFDAAFEDQQLSVDHFEQEEARLSAWDNTAWTSQTSRTSSQPFTDSMVDSSLMRFDEFDFQDSMSPSLPPTPNVPSYPETFPSGPIGELSGTGALFTSPDGWSPKPEFGAASIDHFSCHCCKWKDENGDVCGQVRENEASLQMHIVKEHLVDLDKSSNYRCQWEDCGRLAKRGEEKSGFSQRGKLERHLATHTGYKCAKCKICGKEFSAQQSLTQHMNLHEKIKPWKCKYCNKAFPQQSACTIHERTHTGDKPLKCEECGKQFSESSNLSKHRKTHGEKGMHCCQYFGCTKSFHRLDQLRRHHAVHSKELARASPVSTVKSEGDM
ncbi:uncharacterized protein BP5553_01949 [Venustampulla echinocandica]|uniref:C2H2-type domain-containing protein n=1 Tax=Venustampulla echinocandica TaxID=2656787 RepID=A0A370U2G1_9HELO|nr:uncharacterized protein BP5553_01949 [Venustampulla echinocandica]RDL41970.1 hypothetical protein BP5553_01949 [Venustampulla echinocandica]